MSFIYLGSPYTHVDSAIVRQRFRATEACTARLLIAGKHVYSPIVHCHSLAEQFDLPKSFNFWQRYNFAMLAKASELYVLCLPGWESSHGLSSEIAMAQQLSIPITYLEE